VLSPGSKGYSLPKTRAEVHLKLCERLLRESEELLAKKDYVQASEKFWRRPLRWLRRWRLKDVRHIVVNKASSEEFSAYGVRVAR